MVGRSGGYSPLLSAYRFCAVNTDAAMTGFFVTQDGLRTGAMFTLTVSSAALKGFNDIAGGLPDDAVGVMFSLTNDCRFGLIDTSGNAPSLADVQAYGVPWLSANSPIAPGRIA